MAPKHIRITINFTQEYQLKCIGNTILLYTLDTFVKFHTNPSDATYHLSYVTVLQALKIVNVGNPEYLSSKPYNKHSIDSNIIFPIRM